ncbi:2863_t:CDS:2 [Scutellospora calospora]|uniref:2863_t:CDS:1 n=1 Tax=Scutellospora calospora TaxID=85575 RepID=A0ACA9JYD3_9GLOM|nr:2863_t:CDS:2 [Scutellospora calospora]
MYKAQWKTKLAKNKHGDSPTDEYLPFIEIIYRLPRTEIFNPNQSAKKIYPNQSKRRTKGDPRPINSFMILTLVVRKVAETETVDLGDGRSCIRICQLMRWGATKDEWEIFLKLQKDFKKIHSTYFPLYDYRKKPPVSDTSEFVIVNSDNYEVLVSQSRKKITSPTEPSSPFFEPHNNGRLTANYPYAIASPQNIPREAQAFYSYKFISPLDSQDNFTPSSPSSSCSSDVIVPSSPLALHEGIVSQAPNSQIGSQDIVVPSSSPVSQVGCQDIIVVPGSHSTAQERNAES